MELGVAFGAYARSIEGHSCAGRNRDREGEPCVSLQWSWERAAVLPAGAAEFVSAYTDVDLEQCEMLSSDEVGATWALRRSRRLPVTISEGDLRMTGPMCEDAMDEVAMSQGFARQPSLGAKMEWLSPRTIPIVPVATILRWYLQKGEGPGESQILVVTQLEPGAVCQIAWIDATANPNANEMARAAAEDLAGNFNCEAMPRIYGEFEAFEIE